jgi:polyhydroxybutyrate depolymerase
VIAIQGDDDGFVPIQGGVEGWRSGLGEGGELESADKTRAFWVAHNHCDSEPTVTQLPVRVRDGTAVTRIAHGNGAQGTEVIWYVIRGGGHRWPPNQVPTRIRRFIDHRFGVSSANLDASAVLWQFFQDHPKP